MTTALITHAACLQHQPPPGHPERPGRLEEMLADLKGPEFGPLLHKEAPLVEERALTRVHDRDYVQAVLNAVPDSGYVRFDSDTIGSPGTREAMLRAAGAVVLGVDLVLTREVRNVFCAVRPPGHHALPARAMGFCIFNNVAVGAAHARANYGITRVAVIDFDVHHGNGTQDMFFSDPGLFYASTHQSPLYPGTGYPDETGVADNILNLPLPPGAGSVEFRHAFETVLVPRLSRFKPELVIISAGFDAHRADPLASLRLEESDFAWATESLCALAAEACQSRVVSALEGGYDLGATARSAAAHVKALMAAH